MGNRLLKSFNEHKGNSNMVDKYKKVNELSSRENELFTKMTNTIYEIMKEGYLTKDEIINWIKVHINEDLIQ